MTIDNREDVARILANDWVINGVLQQTAFTLRDGETYISVNRPAVTHGEQPLSIDVEVEPRDILAPDLFFRGDCHMNFNMTHLNCAANSG